ncbi:hypothetical protein U1Q18_040320, partial [Sarracenia purpurea var. burkii]
MYPKVDGDGGFTGFGASGLYPVQGVRLWVDDDVGDTHPGGAFEAGLCSPMCTGSLYRQREYWSADFFDGYQLGEIDEDRR